MKIDPAVFRDYDIRGIAGENFSEESLREYEKWYGPFPGITLTLEAANAIGKAYGTIIAKEGGARVVVGHEMRPFAEELTEAFISGVRRTGCSVVDLGRTLTPIVYFHVAHGGFDGGVNITGSHNVYFFNGFKLMKRNVWPLWGEELQKMHRMIEAEEYKDGGEEGRYEKTDGYKPYREYVSGCVEISRPVHVVVDCGNGSAGMFAPDLLRTLGCEVTELYTDLDPSFPNHVPDPEARQSLGDLAEKVRETKADFGIAFDADGDRVGFLTEHGEFIESDFVLLVLARDVLARHPGKKILFDVKCTGLLPDLILSYGGVPLMHRTGHAPIKETMRDDKEIVLGGEASGHFYFVEDYFRIDDGLFGAARVLELFSKTSGSFSELFKDIPRRVLSPEFKLPCTDEKKFEVISRIKDAFSSFSPVLLDGVRFRISETGWGLVRASNTSPYLTVRVEGKDEAEALKMKNMLADELEKFPEVTDRLNRLEVATLTGKLGWV